MVVGCPSMNTICFQGTQFLFYLFDDSWFQKALDLHSWFSFLKACLSYWIKSTLDVICQFQFYIYTNCTLTLKLKVYHPCMLFVYSSLNISVINVSMCCFVLYYLRKKHTKSWFKCSGNPLLNPILLQKMFHNYISKISK